MLSQRYRGLAIQTGVPKLLVGLAGNFFRPRLFDRALRHHFSHRFDELVIGFAKLALRRHVETALDGRPHLDRFYPARQMFKIAAFDAGPV